MTEEVRNANEELLGAELAYQAAIHSELFSATTRVERDRMLTVAILSLAFVFLGIASSDVSIGPFRFGVGEWWALPLGLSLVNAYFMGSFVVSGFLDRKLWFVRSAPLGRDRLRAITQSMSAVQNRTKAFFDDIKLLQEKQQKLTGVRRVISEATSKRPMALSDRAEKGELYDLNELKDEFDPDIVPLKEREQSLKVDLDASTDRFMKKWPKERLQESSAWKGGGYDWTWPYWFQMAWIFAVPLAVAILAEVALIGTISHLKNDVSRNSDAPPQQGLACSVAGIRDSRSVKNQIVVLNCVALPDTQSHSGEKG